MESLSTYKMDKRFTNYFMMKTADLWWSCQLRARIDWHKRQLGCWTMLWSQYERGFEWSIKHKTTQFNSMIFWICSISLDLSSLSIRCFVCSCLFQNPFISFPFFPRNHPLGDPWSLKGLRSIWRPSKPFGALLAWNRSWRFGHGGFWRVRHLDAGPVRPEVWKTVNFLGCLGR